VVGDRVHLVSAGTSFLLDHVQLIDSRAACRADTAHMIMAGARNHADLVQTIKDAWRPGHWRLPPSPAW